MSIVSETGTQLPREGSCEEVIHLKLKKKLSSKGHVYFESVKPRKVRAALEYLQKVNPLCYDVLIGDSDINPLQPGVAFLYTLKTSENL